MIRAEAFPARRRRLVSGCSWFHLVCRLRDKLNGNGGDGVRR
jgi:hypothetical protein